MDKNGTSQLKSDPSGSSSGRPPDLRTMYCAVHNCAPDQYLERALRDTVHRRALPFLALIRLVSPTFFASDLDLISDAGSATRLSEILMTVNNFRNDCQRERRFVHDQLRIRISGRRFYQTFARAREKYLQSLAHKPKADAS